MNQYKQLTEGQRYQISALLKVETLQKDIALILAGSRYFCESLFWASQPKQAAKT
ncbi:hypothetical protein [Bathymodiolus platifrons methanotrophic gill symbiont]|uniref:hypothetical protein n=1 Tax=Bathymodiolus platifrons methanotrophic gill symbiont TaxID=113268 RepID=UPI001C8F09E3|nr:hypothetical protein [Bathymodiolus platifrons methanotrophic gill symbiont]